MQKPTLWPPDTWQVTRTAAGKDPGRQTEAELALDEYAKRFRASCPSTGEMHWSIAERVRAMKQFMEQVEKMGLGVSGKDKPAYAKSKIYAGFVFEESGQFSLAAESFQDALDGLDEQSDNLQEEPFWQAQQNEADVRFEAMDVLGAEHEAEVEAHKKLDQELESISTGRREDMQQAFGGYAHSMMAYHGRSLATISSMAHGLERSPKGMFPQDMTEAVGEALKGRDFEMIPAPVSLFILMSSSTCPLQCSGGVFPSNEFMCCLSKSQSLRVGELRITVGLGDPTAARTSSVSQ